MIGSALAIALVITGGYASDDKFQFIKEFRNKIDDVYNRFE